MSDPAFLDLDDILLIHEEQHGEYGGSAGVRDLGLLESAVAMPRAIVGGTFAHEDVFAMAAAYAFHIAQNQPFIDGNKRTGLLAAVVFLDVNLRSAMAISASYRAARAAAPRSDLTSA